MLRRWLSNETGSTTPEWAFIVSILVLAAVGGMIMTRQVQQIEEQSPTEQLVDR